MPRAPTLKQIYPKGCAPPSGYVAWHAWARAQGAHGLKQSRCKACGRYYFPQQMPTHDCDDSKLVLGKGGKAKRLRG